MHYDENVWGYMAKSLFGEATQEEMDRLNHLLEHDAYLRRQYEILLQTISKNERHTVPDRQSREDVARIIQKASGHSDEQRNTGRPVRIRWYLAVAAGLSALVLIGRLLLPFGHHPQQKSESIAATPALEARHGTRTQTTLPDGSQVWLNSGSGLYYDKDFKGATREVRLVGEAFFDVMKDSARPFIVHVNDIDIRVIGTAFNVKAYPNEKTIETTLYRGRVNVSKNNDNSFKPVRLYPNQKLILQAAFPSEKEVQPRSKLPAQPSVIVKEIDSTVAEPQRMETAWIHNRLEFDGEDFGTLAGRLERWYDVRIRFGDEEVKRLNFRGSFERETIEQALMALQAANSFHYNIENNEIFISSAQ